MRTARRRRSAAAIGGALGVAVAACFSQPPAPAQGDGGSGGDGRGPDGKTADATTGSICPNQAPPTLWMVFSGSGNASSCTGTNGSGTQTTNGLVLSVSSPSTGDATCNWALPGGTTAVITSWRAFASGSAAETIIQLQDPQTSYQNTLRYLGINDNLTFTDNAGATLGAEPWPSSATTGLAFTGIGSDTVDGLYTGDFVTYTALGSSSWAGKWSSAAPHLYVTLNFSGAGAGSSVLTVISTCP